MLGTRRVFLDLFTEAHAPHPLYYGECLSLLPSFLVPLSPPLEVSPPGQSFFFIYNKRTVRPQSNVHLMQSCCQSPPPAPSLPPSTWSHPIPHVPSPSPVVGIFIAVRGQRYWAALEKKDWLVFISLGCFWHGSFPNSVPQILLWWHNRVDRAVMATRLEGEDGLESG